jgi:hypothetical protein
LTLGHTDFTDLTNEEYAARLGKGSKTDPETVRRLATPLKLGSATYGDSISWVNMGMVETTAYNQGLCAAGWAFAAADAITSAQAITRGSLIALSQQQLVSCMGLANGCTGTTSVAEAFLYTMDNPLTFRSAYTYTNGGST